MLDPKRYSSVPNNCLNTITALKNRKRICNGSETKFAANILVLWSLCDFPSGQFDFSSSKQDKQAALMALSSLRDLRLTRP